MEKFLGDDVIEKVEEFISWVFLVVIIFKKMVNEIWLNVDMREVNKVILWIYIIMFIFEDIMYEFNGVVVFFYLDMNYGYY